MWAMVFALQPELSGSGRDDGRRGLQVDHITIARWVGAYAGELEQRISIATPIAKTTYRQS
jgi:hypothetical protein